MQVLTTAPPASHARAHHGAVLSFSPQVRIAPAPGSQASGTWYVDPTDCMLIASLISQASGTWYVDPPDCMLIASLIPSGTWYVDPPSATALWHAPDGMHVLTTAPAPLPHRYVDPVLRLWHAPDGLARNGRLVKAERVAVSTSVQVEPLEGDSVRRDEHLQAEPLDGDSVSLSVLTTAPAPLPHRWSRWKATRFR